MEPTDRNRRAFDERHVAGAPGRAGLPVIVRRTLGSLTKKRVLHLQCGTGEGAAELAELGAVVTAIDESAEALEAARERWPSILWVQGTVQALPSELRRRRFDLVYSPEGVLARLEDLDAWVRGIAGAIPARGELLMYEEHPVAECVDRLLRWHHDYFDESLQGERLWRLGQLVTAIARGGLGVEALEEYPGDSAWRRHDRRVPGSFLLYARRKA
ncbi:MAG TPA: class I SAM-dependent methyltransferase [Gaiellaceae bacterium]|jgi:predicted TPR repeat methyltransferase|nr:class I SAM-dependent methyltransferase [Gaiellaceae bacterium]